MDALREEYSFNTGSLDARQMSSETYHLHPWDPLPAITWESLIEIGFVADYSTMVEQGATYSVD